MPTRQVNKVNNANKANKMNKANKVNKANKSVGGGRIGNILNKVRSKLGFGKKTVAPYVEPDVAPYVEPDVAPYVEPDVAPYVEPVRELDENELVNNIKKRVIEGKRQREREIERTSRKYTKVAFTGDDINTVTALYDVSNRFSKYYKQNERVENMSITIENCSTIKDVIDALLDMERDDKFELNRSIAVLTWNKFWHNDVEDKIYYINPYELFVYIKFDSEYKNCSLYDLEKLNVGSWDSYYGVEKPGYFDEFDDKKPENLTRSVKAENTNRDKYHSISGPVTLKQLIIPREASSSRQSVRPSASSSRVPSRLRPLPRRLTPLPPLQEQRVSGGKKSSKPVRKEILGKIRCVYKVPGSRKDHVKCKGKLITVKKYKELMKKAKTKKTKAKY
jgi:hypothetical protein